MTIDEAIENEKRRAESCKGHYDRFVQMEAEEHEQLAEWLEELKELRNMTSGHLYAVAFKNGYLKAEKEVREKTIDDFARKLITHFADWELSNTPCNDDETDRTKEIICETIENAIGGVEEIAEQLKAGGDNESK